MKDDSTYQQSNFRPQTQGISSGFEIPEATDFVVVVSGDVCSPCQPLKPHLRPDAAAAQMAGLRAGWSGEGLALLLRDQNEGMDFAAHNVRPSSFQSKVLACPSSLRPSQV